MAARGASGRYVGGRFTRRQVAGAGVAALGGSALAGGTFGLVRDTRAQSQGEPHSTSTITSAGPNPWREPPVLMSVDGLLDVALEAKPLLEAGMGKMAYNGLIPGPTFRFRAGDTVRLKRWRHCPPEADEQPRRPDDEHARPRPARLTGGE
jgi:hypothetical protein